MGLFGKNTASATASPDGSAPAEGKGSFLSGVLRDAIGQLKAQGGFDSGLSGAPKAALKIDLIDDKFEGKGMKKGGKVKASSASKRADGIATKGKTRGRMI